MFLETDKRQPVETLSPSVLAFMGDAVYGMLVREKLCEVNRPSGDLHRLSVMFVSASSQSEAYKIIGDLLTENEQLERYSNEQYRMDYIEEIAREELDYSYADEKIYYFVPSN